MKYNWITIRVDGVVQGVGFRPAVYRAARYLGLKGTVENAVDGVYIRVNTSNETVNRLIALIKKFLPPAARIDKIEIIDSIPPESFTDDFRIIASDHSHKRPTDISPDIAICSDCLEDIRLQQRRIGYPLTNCTYCGPRFTIIRMLPYDRSSTTMSPFNMCRECRNEYSDPMNRRFHAQPIACNYCGPTYSLFPDPRRIKASDQSNESIETGITDYEDIIKKSYEILHNGGILMCKSLGGYNLMVDATNEGALIKLREIKHRPRKPFAVMVADLQKATDIAFISSVEQDQLSSWRAPITILRMKDNFCFPHQLAPGYATIGIMLPYMAFQHHLLKISDNPIAVTSANFLGSPIIKDENEAIRYAEDMKLPLVTFNREIVNRVDDSVVRVCGGEPRILRKSRGYVPEGLRVDTPVDGIIGMGADISAQWAFGRDHDIIQSQYIGSLTNEGGEEFLKESVNSLTSLFQISPRVIVIDLHPAYRSSALGKDFAMKRNIPVILMQHHHAHAVSVMAEYGITKPVMALILDGTGYGTDNTVWGSELFLCDRTSFTRIDHGIGLPMPGGDIAAKEPWRMTIALLHTLFPETDILNLLPTEFVKHIGENKIRFIVDMINKHINSPITYGAGRLWDAIASLLGLAYYNGYESEAPILLENIALKSIDESCRYNSSDINNLLESILSDISLGIENCEIAKSFHKWYAEYWIRKIECQVCKKNVDSIVLAGGVLQNALLTDLLQKGLESIGLKVYIPLRVPCGDGGIAVGQIAYAAAIENNISNPISTDKRLS